MLPQSSTNLKNRVAKLHLPRTKPLLPLFEVISNSIHAIKEKTETLRRKYDGSIKVGIIRNGKDATLASLPDIDNYPINSFTVEDNGIGFNQENLNYFAEFDTENKAGIGGKGIGRLVCLKVFQKLRVESVYDDGVLKMRKFEYKKREGFDNYSEDLPTVKKNTGTIFELHKYEPEFEYYVPKGIYDVSREIITHFQLYFIQKLAPEIIVRNQNGIEVNLGNLFNLEFANEIQEKPFKIGDYDFMVIISKSYKAKSHKIHYCAHQRTVKEEGLSKYLEDLRHEIPSTDLQKGFFYQVFVVGKYLDDNVNEERTNFHFRIEDDEDEIESEVSLAKIRNETIKCIEVLLNDFLIEARKEKLAVYYPIIQEEFPNYLSVINYNKSKVEKLPAGLTRAELDLKLYEIESEWRIEIKKDGVDLLAKKKDITTLAEYKLLYEKYLTEFNEIGKSDLARYMVHRRSVIDLLEQLIQLNNEDKFTNEDIVHSLFFPIKETKDTVMHEKQNLWLLDERLTFNTLLASDKSFKQIKKLDSNSKERMDLIVKKEEVFEDAALFAESKIPFESFTILEFKKPERDDYEHGNIKKDPIKQVRNYAKEIVQDKAKIKGKSAGASKLTPFYCYIIADITPSLEDILKEEEFDPTPDGLGRFRFYDTDIYKAYIEVLPFKKIIRDSKQRNQMLFNKLLLG